MPEMTPRAFSFNSPHGACPECQGLGAMVDFDPQRVVPDESKSLADGAIAPWARGDRKLVRDQLLALSRDFGIDLAAPFARLPRRSREILLFGSGKSAGGSRAETASTSDGGRARGSASPRGLKFEGLIPNLRRRFADGNWAEQDELDPYRSLRACPACKGERLKAQSLSVRVKGRTIADYVNIPVSEALNVFDSFELTDREAIIAERILREIHDRLRFLNDVGVSINAITASCWRRCRNSAISATRSSS
jgi:excinuclease ABC subunit A